MFNALTKGGASVANFPFSTVSPNVGMVSIPDPRLGKIAVLIKPQVVTPAAIEVIDVAGLIKDAHKGEGLGNEFLSRIRGVNVLIQVVRCFEEDVPHPEGLVDPIKDVETIETELFLSDLDILQRRLTRLHKSVKSSVTQNDILIEVLHKVEKALEEGTSPCKVLSPREYETVKKEEFLSLKPMLYVANIGEEDIELPGAHVKRLRDFATRENIDVIEVCAQLEMELAEFPEEEKRRFIQEMGIAERAIERLPQEVFNKLNLITFFTITGGREVRAWAIEKGSSAVEAADKVHSDIKRGFIKAEVIGLDQILKFESFKKARSEGKVRIEGKECEVKDGDIIHFYFAP